MNPIFVLIVIMVAIAVWFLLAFLYRPLGGMLFRIWKDSIDEIDGKNIPNKKEQRKEK
ncbi:MAG: hypothetical protein RR365_10850 [Bacteroides sp.]